jgi:hypothetical protein
MDPPSSFKSNLSDLCEFVISLFHRAKEQNVNVKLNEFALNIGKNMLHTYSGERLINNFIDKSYIHWNLIHEKDEETLYHKGVEIFSDLPNFVVMGIRDLLFSTTQDGERFLSIADRDYVWSVLHSMIKCCIKYIYEKRCPKVNEDGVRKFTVTFQPHIKINAEVVKWQVCF